MGELINKGRTLLKTGFFHIFGSSVINKIIGFLSSVVLVRILSKVEYGVFTYAWNIYSIILLFNGMGIESGVLQMSSEHSGDEQYGSRVSNYGVRFGVKFDILLVGAILLVGLFAPLKIEASRNIMVMLCFLPMVQLLYLMTTSFLRAQKRNQEYARLTIINTALVFVISAGCAFLFREKGLVIGYYVAYLASFGIGIIWYKVRIINHDGPIEEDDKKSLLKISAITMCNNGLSQMMYLLDVFVLGIVDPQETILASYKVATMIPSALAFIPLSLIIYLYPYFAEHRGDGKWCLQKYKQILIGMGGLNLFISATMFIGAPLIVKLLFGVEYLDCVPIFRLLSVNYFFSGTFRILSGNLLVTQRKLKFNLIVAVIACSVNIIADYFFIQWWGAIGAAIATCSVVLLTSIMNTVYLVYTFRKNAKVK